MSCKNMVDVELQSILFFIKSLFSIQDSLALLFTVTVQLSMNMSKEILESTAFWGWHIINALEHRVFFQQMQQLKKKMGGKKPQNMRNETLILIGCSLI